MLIIKQLKQVSTSEEMEQIKQLYLSNGWIDAKGGESSALIEKIISHTFHFVVAVDNDRIIGMGRSISDGVSDGYIQDVTVLPDYRKQGIGGKIIQYLVDYLRSNGIGWIGLISEPGYESFYQGQGFAVMQNYTPFLFIAKNN